jgi:hypothetical protein
VCLYSISIRGSLTSPLFELSLHREFEKSAYVCWEIEVSAEWELGLTGIYSVGAQKDVFLCIVLGIQVLAFHSHHEHCNMVQGVRTFKHSTLLDFLSMLQTRGGEEMSPTGMPTANSDSSEGVF